MNPKKINKITQMFVAAGFLVPVLDAKGQPVRRDGDIVYRLTDDPDLRRIWIQKEGLSQFLRAKGLIR
jgi:hypothetical protein